MIKIIEWNLYFSFFFLGLLTEALKVWKHFSGGFMLVSDFLVIFIKLTTLHLVLYIYYITHIKSNVNWNAQVFVVADRKLYGKKVLSIPKRIYGLKFIGVRLFGCLKHINSVLSEFI